MKRFELKFLDGPGAGRSIEADKPHPSVWLCEEAGIKWWTFTEPLRPKVILAKYELLGSAPRRDNGYLIAYGVRSG
jgi:hypothetical protein